MQAVSDAGGDARVASVSDNQGDTARTVSDTSGDAVCVSNQSGAVSDEPGDAVCVSNKSGVVSDEAGARVAVFNKSGKWRGRVR